jgi:hypothetical protein
MSTRECSGNGMPIQQAALSASVTWSIIGVLYQLFILILEWVISMLNGVYMQQNIHSVFSASSSGIIHLSFTLIARSPVRACLAGSVSEPLRRRKIVFSCGYIVKPFIILLNQSHLDSSLLIYAS